MFFGLFGFVWLVSFSIIISLFWKMRSDKDFLIKMIKWKNEIQGVETKVTPKTIKWMTLSANFGIIVGLIMLLMFLSSFVFSSLLGFLTFFFR